MSIVIDILKFGLINFSKMAIEITEANLQHFKYADIN